MNIAPSSGQSVEAARPSWPEHLRHVAVDLLGHVHRRWYLYLPVFAIWGLAYVRLFFDATPRVPVLFNWTPSLPYTVALLHKGTAALHRGDFVVFSFAGDGIRHYPGLAGQPFFKIVRGLPGDTISVVGREIRINGEPVGVAKTHAFDRHPLAPIAPGVIPAGRYYVQGLSPDSFDSRYRESGLVRVEQVIGVVDPLF